VVIDRFEYEAPQTKRMLGLVSRLGFEGRKVLILTDGVKPNVFLSGRNIPTVHVMPYSDASTYHILWSDVVLVEAGAIGQTLEPVKETAEPLPTRERAAAAKRPAAKREAKPARAAAKAPTTKTAKHAARKAAKTAAKSAAKKPSARKTTAKKSAAKKSTKRKEK
jgi:septal ring-binding cell division protein DamX